MDFYDGLLGELFALADETYANFHSRLLNNADIKVIGVKTPLLRSLAKKYKGDVKKLFALPDDYYEVTFLKLTVLSSLPYDEFIAYADDGVKLINNWASCDCFKAKCISKHKSDFVPFVKAYLGVNKEFYQRYALVTLLHFYVEEEYLDFIFDCMEKANTDYYYVHTAVAWLLAEVVVKYYDRGVDYLKRNLLDVRTHDKAIAKSCESLRLTLEQKKELKGLKRR